MDTNFIAAVQHAVTIIVTRYGPMCAQQVTKHLKDARVTKVELGVADVKTILSTLVLDGKLSLTTPMTMPDALKDDYLNRMRERENAAEQAMIHTTNRAAASASAAAAAAASAGGNGASSATAAAFAVKRPRLGNATSAVAGYNGNGDDDDHDNEGEDDDEDEDEDELTSDALVYTITPGAAAAAAAAAAGGDKAALEGKYGFVKATTLSAPCIGCQIKDKCRPGGAVEPSACMYLRQWLADGF